MKELKMKIIRILLPLFILFFSCTSDKEEKIVDLIKSINLIAGKTDSVLVSDLFYSKDYNLKFNSHPKIKLVYNAKKKYLSLTPNANFSGITLIEFDLRGIKYHIPVRSQILENVSFTYMPDKQFNKITLFGTFDGWNRNSNEMRDEDGDGVYEVAIALEPGVYQYKFFTDGVEIADPQNPNKVPSGVGDFNSVINVPERFKDKVYLHIDKPELSEDNNKYSFIYERENQLKKLEKSDLIALIDNQRINDEVININENRIEITFSKDELKEDNVLRIAVVQNGQNTNLQTLILQNSKSADGARFTWYDGIIYSLMIDRFNDGDRSINKPVEHDSILTKANYLGGDFQGVINKIDEGYFDSLGINVIWISPVYDSPNDAYKEYPPPHRWYSGYHGYWPIHHKRVEEKFGNMSKLKELINKAHNHKIKVLLDFVSNHVHEQHPFFKNNRDWFGKLDLPDGRKNLRFWDEFRLTTWFEPYMPSFDYLGSNEALETITNNAVWWIKETGADGFRHDAVKHVPNKFWRRLTEKLRSEIEFVSGKKLYQIGETFGGYDLISSYVNNNQLNGQFNFNLYDIAVPTLLDPRASFVSIDREMQKTFKVYGNLHLMGNIMDSHDKPRFMSYADGDLPSEKWSDSELGWNDPPVVNNEENYKKALLYLAFMNTVPGLPVIYYGSEFGMTGAADPDNRRMMRFNEELNENEKEMLKKVSKIIRLRKNHTALRYGDFFSLIANYNIYSYIRSDMNERIIIILNKSPEDQSVKLTLPYFYRYNYIDDLTSNKLLEISNNEVEFLIDGFGYSYYVLK